MDETLFKNTFLNFINMMDDEETPTSFYLIFLILGIF